MSRGLSEFPFFQVPVACKKCGCGHTFFVARRGASCVSTNRENSEESEEMPTSPQGQEELKPTRRSGRVTRERPNFYDALEYENQTRRVSVSFHYLWIWLGVEGT